MSRCRKIDLRTARFVLGKSQYELEAMTGIGHPRISKFETHGIGLSKSEREKIEQALGIEIDFDQPNNPEWRRWRYGDDPLTKEELAEMKVLTNMLMRRCGEEQMIRWISSYGSAREMYEKLKEAIDQFAICLAPPKLEFEEEEL